MDIVERLCELRLGNKEYDVVVDAIAEIELLRKERARLREALRYYAKTDYFPTSDGPWGVDSDDFGNIARAALKEGE